MDYKLQWIDDDGFHYLESNDYNALYACYKALRNTGSTETDSLEFWDMTNNNPVRII